MAEMQRNEMFIFVLSTLQLVRYPYDREFYYQCVMTLILRKACEYIGPLHHSRHKLTLFITKHCRLPITLTPWILVSQ